MDDNQVIDIFHTIQDIVKHIRCKVDYMVCNELITPIEGMICVIIYDYMKEEKEISISDIARISRVTLSAVMHKIKDLERKKIIEKYTVHHDKRTKYLRLSNEALIDVDKLLIAMNKRKLTTLKSLEDEDLKHLSQIVKKLKHYMEENNV